MEFGFGKFGYIINYLFQDVYKIGGIGQCPWAVWRLVS